MSMYEYIEKDRLLKKDGKRVCYLTEIENKFLMIFKGKTEEVITWNKIMESMFKVSEINVLTLLGKKNKDKLNKCKRYLITVKHRVSIKTGLEFKTRYCIGVALLDEIIFK